MLKERSKRSKLAELATFAEPKTLTRYRADRGM